MKTKLAAAKAFGGVSDGGGPRRGLVGKLVGDRRRFSRKLAAGGSAVSTNSPGRARGTPYNNSAAETLWSSLGADLRPSRIQGKCEGHSLPASLALKASFSWR